MPKIDFTKSGKMILQFGYSKSLVEAIKELPDRRYNPEEKTWTVGYDQSNLGEIFAILAGNNWPQELLNPAEAKAREYLKARPAPELGAPVAEVTQSEFDDELHPLLHLMSELANEAYLAGRIDNTKSVKIIEMCNHLVLRDFIMYCRHCREKKINQ